MCGWGGGGGSVLESAGPSRRRLQPRNRCPSLCLTPRPPGRPPPALPLQVHPHAPLIVIATCHCDPQDLPPRLLAFFSQQQQQGRTIGAVSSSRSDADPPGSGSRSAGIHWEGGAALSSGVLRCGSDLSRPADTAADLDIDLAPSVCKRACQRAAAWIMHQARPTLYAAMLAAERAAAVEQQPVEEDERAAAEEVADRMRHAVEEGEGEAANAAPKGGAGEGRAAPVRMMPPVAAAGPALSDLDLTALQAEESDLRLLQLRVQLLIQGVATALLSHPACRGARADLDLAGRGASAGPFKKQGRNSSGRGGVSMQAVVQRAAAGEFQLLGSFLTELRAAAVQIRTTAAAAGATGHAAPIYYTARQQQQLGCGGGGGRSHEEATLGAAFSSLPPGLPVTARLAANAAGALLDVAEEMCAAAAARLGLTDAQKKTLMQVGFIVSRPARIPAVLHGTMGPPLTAATAAPSGVIVSRPARIPAVPDGLTGLLARAAAPGVTAVPGVTIGTTPPGVTIGGGSSESPPRPSSSSGAAWAARREAAHCRCEALCGALQPALEEMLLQRLMGAGCDSGGGHGKASAAASLDPTEEAAAAPAAAAAAVAVAASPSRPAAPPGGGLDALALRSATEAVGSRARDVQPAGRALEGLDALARRLLGCIGRHAAAAGAAAASATRPGAGEVGPGAGDGHGLGSCSDLIAHLRLQLGLNTGSY